MERLGLKKVEDFRAPLRLSDQISLRNRLAIAPMAGLTDIPFRTLCWRFGAGYTVSEMVTSKEGFWSTDKSRLRRLAVPGVYPWSVQIAGSDPGQMIETAKKLVQEGVQVIDVNFGCPAKKVCRRLAGSALLKDLDLIERIVSELVNALDVPVTIKTRTGLTRSDDLGQVAILRAESVGARMAVLHGRSKECKFQGTADYRKIRSVVETVHIPIFANGDINDLDSAILAAEKSGSDGLMIGRGAIGQPWIFSCMLGKELPLIEERLIVMNEHLDAIHSFYGRERGTRVSRKHLMAYFTRLRAPELGKEFVSLGTSQEQTAWLRNIDVEMVKSFSSSAEEAAIAA